MNNRPDPIALALLSWAYWAGEAALVESLQRPGRLGDEFQAPAIQKILTKIAAGLYYPPSQDTAAATSIYEHNWLDDCYRQLSDLMGVRPAPFWPDHKHAALIISHDVDRSRTTYQHLAGGYRKGGAPGLLRAMVFQEGRRPDPFRNFSTIRETERRWGVKSTIFILKERRRYRRLLRGEVQHCLGVYDPVELAAEFMACAAQGSELGLHLSFDSFRDRAALKEERLYVEEHCRCTLTGARSHYLNFETDTPELLMAEGFDYDSSMGFNFAPGFRCGTAFPFVLAQRGDKLVWEVPLHVMDTSLFWLCSRLRRPWKEVAGTVRRISDAAWKSGGVLCINGHQRFFNHTSQPEWMELLEEIVQAWSSAWKPTLGELTAWWVRRARPEPGAG